VFTLSPWYNPMSFSRILIQILYTPSFYKHRSSFHLYHHSDNGLAECKILLNVRTRFLSTYANVPYICHLEFNNKDFYPVEVTYKNQGLFVVGGFPRNVIPHIPTQVWISLQDTFYHLPQSLREICGLSCFPSR